MGSSTLKAMPDLSAGVHWALAGSRGEYAAGSGAAMRITPLAFLLDPSKAGDRTTIRDVCRITHHNDEAYVGALAVVLSIRSVLAGVWSQQHSFLSAVVDSLPDSAVRDRIEELIQLQLSPSRVSSHFTASGHVVAAVPLALYYAQYIAEEPLSVVLARPISAGGDTDTIASLTGQLAGTVVRATGVPQDLFGGVEGSARGRNDVLVSLFRPSGGQSSGRSSRFSGHARQFQEPSGFDAASTYRCNPSHGALQMQLRLVLLCVTIASYGTQAILAETARTRMEGAICCLARRRAAGWKNLPLSGSPRS